MSLPLCFNTTDSRCNPLPGSCTVSDTAGFLPSALNSRSSFAIGGVDSHLLRLTMMQPTIDIRTRISNIRSIRALDFGRGGFRKSRCFISTSYLYMCLCVYCRSLCVFAPLREISRKDAEAQSNNIDWYFDKSY